MSPVHRPRESGSYKKWGAFRTRIRAHDIDYFNFYKLNLGEIRLKLTKTQSVLFIFMVIMLITNCTNENIKPISEKKIENVSFTYNIEYGLDNISTTIKYWIKDTKMKIQMKQATYYYNSKDNSIYTYDHSKNTAVKEADEKQYPKGSIPPVRKDIPNEPLRDYFEVYKELTESVPKEHVNIEGIPCLLFDFSSGTKIDKFYITKRDGFPIKWEYLSTGTSEKRYTHKVTISNLKFDEVKDEDVMVPSTATVTNKE